MRNLFKKSLAIVVALALCLTALVGAVTVNAETKTGTITADVTVGEATVDVVFTITTDGLNEAVFSYDYDPALGAPTTIKSVNDKLEVATAETGNIFQLSDTSDNGLTDVTEGGVKFTFNKPAVGTYDVTLSVHSAGASGTEEILIDMKPCTATVEIKAACEHTNKTTSEEVTKAATCTEIGYKTVTVTCNDCSEVISVTENVEIPALGHKYNYVNNGDGTHTGTCANDAEHTVTEDHNFVDGTCSACGAAESVACQHENTEFYYDDTHEIVAAKGTIDGETEKGKIFFKCSDCGEIIEEEVSYYYYYTTGAQNGSLEAEILYNFKAQPKHLNRQGDFQDAFFVLDMQKETGLSRKVTNYADAKYDNSDPTTPFYVVSMGVAAKEMTTPIVSTVFVKYNDQWWSGLQFTKRWVDYTTSRFKATKDDKEKTLLADMLTFGAAAQIYFNFNVSDLATDYLGEFSSYVTTTDPIIEDHTVNSLANASSSERNHVGFYSHTLSLGSVIKMKLGFRTDFYKGEDLGELSAVGTYYNKSGNPVSKTYTSADYSLISGYTDRYEFFYDGVAAKDMRKMVTFTINTVDGPVGFDLQTSIESLAARQIAQTSNANLITAVKTMMKYGDSANAYFG